MLTKTYPPAGDSKLAALRLICLPFAGGGTALYHRWRRFLPPSMQLHPVCLPGRENRLDEPLWTDLHAAARQVADEIQPVLAAPFALLGHSMGAWLALELGRELQRRGLPRPALLIVAASRPPHLPAAGGPPMHGLPDDEFVAVVQQRFDGIPPAVRDNAELLRLLLPAIRADIQMMETYQPGEEPPLDVEILALGGATDRAVAIGDLAEWRRHTSRRCSTRLLPGGHFFLFRDEESPPEEAADGARQESRPTAALQLILARLESYL